MGHATRSRVVIDHLVRQHEVEVVVSGRAHDYLKARERDRLGVNKIWGLSIVYEDNQVRHLRTVLSNLRGAFTGGLPKNLATYFELTSQFRPDVVVSDFETWSALYGRLHGLPVVSLDNNQIVNRCAFPPDILAGKEAEYLTAKAIVKAKLPGGFHYLITSFFRPEITHPRTTLHPPVLRPEIRAARPAPGEHLLVYQTSTSNTALPGILAGSGRECRIYGLRRDLAAEVREGRLRYLPFSETAFIEDLRTARAVISGGSFTLMSEAVHLGRPMLSVPVRRQFEQTLNGRYLQKLGFGLTAEAVTAAGVAELLERAGEFERNLAAAPHPGHEETLASLEAVLARAMAEGAPPDEAGP
jgi:uncharacterized protein (TIGR00661 family)